MSNGTNATRRRGSALERRVRRVLHLTLKRQWFDMIASGEKREEYREIKPYWAKRLAGQHYDAVQFRNGYSANSPAMLVEILWIAVDEGRPQWGAPEGKKVYVLRLGDVLEAPNVRAKRDTTA